MRGACGEPSLGLQPPASQRGEHAQRIQRDSVRADRVRGPGGTARDLDGGYSVCFESHSADADLADLFRGLPDDRAQLPRWGYVIRGKVGFRFSDREETYEAGDAYYVPPGHTPVHYAGAEIVEFSPTEILGETIPVVMKNLEAAGVSVASPS
jgi:hypothetical protein